MPVVPLRQTSRSFLSTGMQRQLPPLRLCYSQLTLRLPVYRHLKSVNACSFAPDQKTDRYVMHQLLDHIASLRSSAKWFFLSTLVGIVAGCGGIAFQVTEQIVFRFASQGVAGFSPLEAEGERRLFTDPEVPLSPIGLLLVLTAGGLAAGLLVQVLAPEAEGHGTDAAIEAYHQKRGYIRPIVPIVKLLASAITIGTAGSGGREGPIAQIGAGFGSSLGTWLKLSVRDRRILLAAGMGAGIGAIFARRWQVLCSLPKFSIATPIWKPK